MKKFKLKYKALVYGFPITANNYKSNNFVLKAKRIDEQELYKKIRKEEIDDDDFSFSSYFSLFYYRSRKDHQLYYNFFESINYVDILVDDRLSNKFETTNYIFNEAETLSRIINFEKQLRLIFNIRIKLPMIKVEIYDENGDYYNQISFFREFPNTNGFMNLDKETFEFNSHFYIDIGFLKKIEDNNDKFKKALNYFFNSFDSNDISVRFVLLISSLESLLIYGGKGIKEKLSKRVSRLLRYIYNDEQKVYNEIRGLYKKRSDYIHGDKKTVIEKEDEKILREYVRNALIIYFFHSINTKNNAKQIINNLKKNVELDKKTRMIAQYMNTTDYKKSFKEALKILNE